LAHLFLQIIKVDIPNGKLNLLRKKLSDEKIKYNIKFIIGFGFFSTLIFLRLNTLIIKIEKLIGKNKKKLK
jgi:hypothetical protein